MSFEHVSGLPEDRVSNNLTWEWTGGGSPNYPLLADALIAFYNTDSGAFQASPICEYLSPELSRAAADARVDVYAIPATPGLFGSPVYTEDFTLGAAGGGELLPGECSVVLSFRADTSTVPEESGATRPRARRRNRIYIGPLSDSTVDSTGSVARVTASFRGDLIAAFVQMWADASSDAWQLRAWSQTDWVGRPPVAGFVDNAFDIQRRRGPDATTRTTFTLPP